VVQCFLTYSSSVVGAGINSHVSWMWERNLLSGVVRADLWQCSLCLPPCRMGATHLLAALCTAPVQASIRLKGLS
jgi:hypothetical protein